MVILRIRLRDDSAKMEAWFCADQYLNPSEWLPETVFKWKSNGPDNFDMRLRPAGALEPPAVVQAEG